MGDVFRVSDMGPDGDTDFDAFFPRVAWDPKGQSYLVTWDGDSGTRAFGDGKFRIFGQWIDGLTFTEVGPNDFQIGSMGGVIDASFDAREPAVAYDSQLQQFLVCWWGDDDAGDLVAGEFEIFGQRLTPEIIFRDGFETP